MLKRWFVAAAAIAGLALFAAACGDDYAPADDERAAMFSEGQA